LNHNIKLLLQNIQKNKTLANTLLETNIDFDIIFIQEPLWSYIHDILSSLSKEEDEIINAPYYLNWITFSRSTSNENDYPWVILHINIYLFYLCFSLQKDIFNHRDIYCFSFFNNGNIYFMINIYSDACQSALKYLKDTEANISNIFVMTSNFNIINSDWNPSFSFHSIHRVTCWHYKLF